MVQSGGLGAGGHHEWNVRKFDDLRRGRRAREAASTKSARKFEFKVGLPFWEGIENQKGSAPARALRNAALALGRSENTATISSMSLTYCGQNLGCLRDLGVL